MSKKHFIALADCIRCSQVRFSPQQLDVLAVWCASQNPRFNKARWLGYILGECGPGGGAVRPKSEAAFEVRLVKDTRLTKPDWEGPLAGLP